MARLTVEHVRRESQGHDATSLHLSHRALSDVTCLSDFRNLERLDLSFNCLENLEALSSCVNLKWLSVVENKLKSLKGVEALSKLTVLNAGRNKLRTMDEVGSVTSLRALILNDNEISSICKLDQLMCLNTLVLSRNPVHHIGDSLVKLTSVTKLSLSHCQIVAIGSSLMKCVELKELRFAHNKITTIPTELVKNVKLQNLDLGNNLIEKWSDLKVLSTMHNLKNLNLQGNPIAEEDKLAKKIKKVVPSLRICNGKPIQKGDASKISPVEDLLHSKKDGSLDNVSDTKPEEDVKKKKLKIVAKDTDIKKSFGDIDHVFPTSAIKVGKEKRRELKRSIKGSKADFSDETKGKDLSHNVADKEAKKRKPINKEESHEAEKETKKKKLKAAVKNSQKNMSIETNDDISNKLVNKYGSKFEGFDDVDKSFVELIFSDEAIETLDMKKNDNEMIPNTKLFDGMVAGHAKRKKTKSIGKSRSALELLSPAAEVGMGGPSTWDG